MAHGKDVGLNSEREALRVDFLKPAGLGDARREPADAATPRRAGMSGCIRAVGARADLHGPAPGGGEPDLPAGRDAEAERMALGYNAAARLAAGSVVAFVATAAYLRERGLSAPAILAYDVAAGLAVLEDLGDDLFATLIAEGERPRRRSTKRPSTLQVALQAEPPPDGAGRSTGGAGRC